MPKGSSKGSDLMVAALENEGVDRIFGVPGEENLDMVRRSTETSRSKSGSAPSSKPGAGQVRHFAKL